MNPIILQLLDNFRLEFLQLCLWNRICFRDDRDNVDLGVQFLHADEIDGFEAVACRTDKVQADVDARVMVRAKVALDFQLFLQIGLELCVNVIDDGLEGILFVDLVTVADSVDDSQL